ncbi:hypothetical protein EV363DRAFT_1297878 [Boletus edulis]|nr:hypothetical protein EV363DRAFT_1297878 [Boletus edulis]
MNVRVCTQTASKGEGGRGCEVGEDEGTLLLFQWHGWCQCAVVIIIDVVMMVVVAQRRCRFGDTGGGGGDGMALSFQWHGLCHCAVVIVEGAVAVVVVPWSLVVVMEQCCRRCRGCSGGDGGPTSSLSLMRWGRGVAIAIVSVARVVTGGGDGMASSSSRVQWQWWWSCIIVVVDTVVMVVVAQGALSEESGGGDGYHRYCMYGYRFVTGHKIVTHIRTRDDFSPKARGFVESSYLRRLTLQEYFFHAMAGPSVNSHIAFLSFLSFSYLTTAGKAQKWRKQQKRRDQTIL